MNTLRVLLIENDPAQSERISSLLEDANHAVLQLSGLEEAEEAIETQKFDAILLSPGAVDDQLGAFRARLRSFETSTRSVSRTPILLCGGEAARQSAGAQTITSAVDGYLPERFEALTFAETVASLAKNVASRETNGDLTGAKELPVFERESFEEQLGYDQDLIKELIELFLAESTDQLAEMHRALASADLSVLSRAAHTLKGSLGSLHCPAAAEQAHKLEVAAKEGKEAACHRVLTNLHRELDALRPELMRLLEIC
jgi:two-component system, sensor histidine kinase and response regulator